MLWLAIVAKPKSCSYLWLDLEEATAKAGLMGLDYSEERRMQQTCTLTWTLVGSMWKLLRSGLQSFNSILADIYCSSIRPAELVDSFQFVLNICGCFCECMCVCLCWMYAFITQCDAYGAQTRFTAWGHLPLLQFTVQFLLVSLCFCFFFTHGLHPIYRFNLSFGVIYIF